MEINQKKRLILFFAIAYGMVAFTSIFMFIGTKMGKELSVFAQTMMLFPACGVILGKLFFGDKEKKLPKAGYIVILVSTAIMLLINIASIFAPTSMIQTGTGVEYSNWQLYNELVIYICSIVTYILFWTCGKEKRSNAGLCRKKIALSILFILLFVVLIVFRIYVAGLYSAYVTGEGTGALSSITEMLLSGSTWANALFVIAYSLPLSWVMFFGEEYGWRYYLQPIMQDKFGKRLGVLLLGLVWAVWHWDADFFFYSKESGLVMFASQFITCVTIAIFFGYAYMKTHNIWVPVILHYINNNLSILLTAGTDVNAIQNQEPQWGDLIFHLLGCLMFAVFIFAPVYNDKRKAAKAGIEESGN